MRLIDDEAQKPTPYYEVGALDNKERISPSDHKELAIVVKKNFKKPDKSEKDEDYIDPSLVESLKK